MIAGSGGQGILFLGKLLAHCAMLEGRNVTWFPSYGAEMRGGTANCTVIISDEIIGSPIVRNPDILVAMNKASAVKFQERLEKGGTMILDASLIKDAALRKDVEVISLPASEIASSCGDPRSANMAILGALISSAAIVKEETATGAIAELTSKKSRKSLEINIEALKKGRAYCGH
jgi:2-oxoglutarate ferredoxin oxidoreductase subunit gamma